MFVVRYAGHVCLLYVVGGFVCSFVTFCGERNKPPPQLRFKNVESFGVHLVKCESEGVAAPMYIHDFNVSRDV